MTRTPIVVFWFRRDLRLDDNAALAAACDDARARGLPLLPLFIFDDDILGRLEDEDDARVGFIHRAVEALHAEFGRFGSGLRVEKGRCAAVWKRLLGEFDARAAFAAEDYEPGAIARDEAIGALLQKSGASLTLVKDQVAFAKREVAKADGKPYTVFTPYAKKWRATLDPGRDLAEHPSRAGAKARALQFRAPVPSLREIGFRPSTEAIAPPEVDLGLIAHYADSRNAMGQPGTSRLGVHLRFGTLSPRRLARAALELKAKGETWLNELVWREFFMQILFNFPHVVDGPFRPEYERIPWRNDEAEFEKWRVGQTGYPIVDAGMREIMRTGFMHNRARMIVASFLTKHLLIDWRWGEAWFARRLHDFELSSNNGNWQWAAGCGCDAAPYFRVFNPTLQAKKFDADGAYVRAWVPEFGTSRYPPPMVDHAMARARALAAYGKGLGRKAPAAPDV